MKNINIKINQINFQKCGGGKKFFGKAIEIYKINNK